MAGFKSINAKLMLIIFIMPLFFSFTTINVQSSPKKSNKTTISKNTNKSKKTKKNRSRSKKRRCYNPAKTIEMTKDIIRQSSNEIADLAGIEPIEGAQKILALPSKHTIEEDAELEAEYNKSGEIEAEDDVIIDIESFKILYLSYMDDGKYDELTPSGISKREIMEAIMDWVGTPYYYGGTSRTGIDCSAFTQKVFLSTTDILLPRTARDQHQVGTKVSRNELQFGDLIFFHTYSRKYASHVGIYLGDNLFAHASSKYGVTVSSLESTYYSKRFIGGKRLTPKDLVHLGTHQKNKTN